MRKIVYGKLQDLNQDICSCGGVAFEIWYRYDMLWSKCIGCGKESLQTLNREY